MSFKNLFILSILFVQNIKSQNYYFLISYKEKPQFKNENENYSKYFTNEIYQKHLSKKRVFDSTDIPVYEYYIEILNGLEQYNIINHSNWLNASLISLNDSSLINQLYNFNFIKEINYLGKYKKKIIAKEEKKSEANEFEKFDAKNILISPEFYGKSYDQNNMINTSHLHYFGYWGQGVKMAVFDAGFYNHNKITSLFENKIFNQFDYVDYDYSVYEDDQHGANVLSTISVYNPSIYVGTAPACDFYLFRTEIGDAELKLEEINWLLAAEKADKLGIDIISSSLGYTQFDDVSLNYNFSNLNGTTSFVAQAAKMAIKKGIIVINSAGNEGNKSWKHIGTPADLEDVITIGSVDVNGNYVDFSSQGPNANLNIKPDFVTMGKNTVVVSSLGAYKGNGTSYSTPIFAGGMACLMSACPGLSLLEYKKALMLSSSLFQYPDNLMGYGIPDFKLASVILGNNRGIDSTKDMLWEKSFALPQQLVPIHFRSAYTQTLTIKVYYKKRKKYKSYYTKKVTLKKGEWYHSNEILGLILKGKSKKYKNLKVIIKSNDVSNMKIITL